MATRTRHGLRATPEYKVWHNMIQRCENEKNPTYRYYGAIGITVCERWKSFELFFADVGPRPSSRHSIDRINVNGNYEPENVKWSVRREQALNKHNTTRATVNGETLPIYLWAERFGVHPETIRQRMKSGWDPERAVTQPSRRRKAG